MKSIGTQQWEVREREKSVSVWSCWPLHSPGSKVELNAAIKYVLPSNKCPTHSVSQNEEAKMQHSNSQVRKSNKGTWKGMKNLQFTKCKLANNLVVLSSSFLQGCCCCIDLTTWMSSMVDIYSYYSVSSNHTGSHCLLPNHHNTYLRLLHTVLKQMQPQTQLQSPFLAPEGLQ